MKISELYKIKKQPVSFEIFPPKGELSVDAAQRIIGELAPLKPDYISVTRTDKESPDVTKTIEISSIVKNKYGIDSVAHLTCINSDKSKIGQTLERLKQCGVENILALLGNLPENFVPGDYLNASELISDISDSFFCIGAACYPEGHIDAPSLEDDLRYIKLKQDLGADFFISQLFFDNRVFLDFAEKARAHGISVPISAGIMPILSQGQVSRMIFTCGVSLPSAIIRILYKYADNPEDLRKAGIEYARLQMEAILSQTDCGVHLYTMNHPEIARGLLG